jgi:transcriptional regulator with XRE-family HTH domain
MRRMMQWPHMPSVTLRSRVKFDKSMETLAERLRRLRGIKSRMALAIASGVFVAKILEIESGRRLSPNPNTIEALAAALGVTPEYLSAGIRRRSKSGGKLRRPNAGTTAKDLRKFLANIRKAETLKDAQRVALELDRRLRAFETGQ